MNQNHTNETVVPRADDRGPESQDALCAFWKTVHESMQESFDSSDDSKCVELHVRPFFDFILAVVWEDGIGLTLFRFDWFQTSEGFSPPSYLDPDQVRWLVEVAARHGIRCEPDRKSEV